MTAVVPLDVLCWCGWRGQLPTRADCPSCESDHNGRVTKQRLDKMRAVARGEHVSIPANMRAWFVRREIMEMTAAKSARALTPAAHRPRWTPVLTEHGKNVLARAGAPDASPPVDPVRRALARLLWDSVADKAECTCYPGDPCPQCEAMQALGLGRWTGPDERTQAALGAITDAARATKGVSP